MNAVNLVYGLQLNLALQIFIRNGLAQLLRLFDAINAFALLQRRLKEVLLFNKRKHEHIVQQSLQQLVEFPLRL